MKTKALFLAAMFCALSALAQQNSDANAASQELSSDTSTNDAAVTDRAGKSYSLDEIAAQVRKLHGAVQETLPMLEAVADTHSNSISSGKQTTAGAIANALGALLGRSTNRFSDTTVERGTNILGGVARVLTGETTNQPSAQTLADLTTLRNQLQTMTPVLARLDSAGISTNDVPFVNSSSTNRLTPTGREDGRPDEE